MYTIHIHCIVFKLCIGWKERTRRKKMNKIEIFVFGFLELDKVSGTSSM